MNLHHAAVAAIAPFRHLPFAVCVTRERDGVYVAVSEAYATFAGLPAEALVGRASADAFAWVEPEDRSAVLDAVRAEGRFVRNGARVRGPEGHLRRIDLVVRPLPADDEPGLLVSVVDRTDAWKAQRARAATEARYAMVARHGRELVTVHDPLGIILWASPSAREVLGIEPDRLEGIPVAALVHPDERRYAQGALGAMLRGERSSPLTVRMRAENGSWHWMEVLGSALDEPSGMPGAALLLSSRDVTARVEARTRAERLVRSEAAARREAEGRRLLLDAVVERAPAMIAVLSGRELVIERANAAFLRAVRRGPEVVGRPLRDVYPPESGQELVGVAARVVAGGEAAQGRATGVVPVQGGSEVRHYEYRVEPVRDAAGRDGRVSLHAIDVTEAVAAHEALGRSERDYRTLASFGFEMMRASDAEALFRIGLEGLSALIDAEFAGLFDHVGDALRLRSVFGAFPRDVDAGIRRPQSASAGLMGKAVAMRELVYTRDYRSDPDRDPAFEGSNLAGLLAVPVLHGGAVRHVMAFGATRPGWTVDEARLDVAASFRRRLEAALEAGEHLRDIEATREETFRVLGLALEYRDYETRGHTDRVVSLAREFAVRLGLDERARQELAWGAYLHDLGKLSISDAILLKPARLTRQEFAEVERHTVIGEEIARGIAFLPPATLEVIRSHHERWDGNGYPDGLAGEAIPLLARIFSIVDVFDALTSVRPYKEAWSVEAALAQLEIDSGVRFDPQLVQVFLGVVGTPV